VTSVCSTSEEEWAWKWVRTIACSMLSVFTVAVHGVYAHHCKFDKYRGPRYISTSVEGVVWYAVFVCDKKANTGSCCHPSWTTENRQDYAHAHAFTTDALFTLDLRSSLPPQPFNHSCNTETSEHCPASVCVRPSFPCASWPLTVLLIPPSRASLIFGFQTHFFNENRDMCSDVLTVWKSSC
jgi:hypothetical protein